MSWSSSWSLLAPLFDETQLWATMMIRMSMTMRIQSLLQTARRFQGKGTTTVEAKDGKEATSMILLVPSFVVNVKASVLYPLGRCRPVQRRGSCSLPVGPSIDANLPPPCTHKREFFTFRSLFGFLDGMTRQSTVHVSQQRSSSIRSSVCP